MEDLNRTATNLYAYPTPQGITYTKPPRGYKPFHISAYARHGSRFHASADKYTYPLDALARADSAGRLTPLGREVLLTIDTLYRMAHKRIGDLTQVGADQHRGIARRMVRNYPEVFRGTVHVEARSTPILRCVMSMANECMELKRLHPDMTLQCNASHHDYDYLNNHDSCLAHLYAQGQAAHSFREYSRRTVHPDRLMAALFNDPQYVSEHVNQQELMPYLFSMAAIVQNLDLTPQEADRYNLYRIFTPDECFDLWKRWNYRWYLRHAFSPLTHNEVPYMEAHLLRNIILTADTCLASGRRNVTLRFGHDINVMPLACLLHLDDYAFSSDDPDAVAEHWRSYKITPKATNLQFVFYRRKGAPDMVKVLLNEEEMRMPLDSPHAPYYYWSDFRKYCEDILHKADEVLHKYQSR